MKTKLSSFGMPYVTGELLQAVSTASGTTYETKNAGIAISEIYYQSDLGVFQGERLGVNYDVWIPTRAFATTPTIKRSDKLRITLNSTDYYYWIIDIVEGILSPDIEDHYNLTINLRNT